MQSQIQRQCGSVMKAPPGFCAASATIGAMHVGRPVASVHAFSAAASASSASLTASCTSSCQPAGCSQDDRPVVACR